MTTAHDYRWHDGLLQPISSACRQFCIDDLPEECISTPGGYCVPMRVLADVVDLFEAEGFVDERNVPAQDPKQYRFDYPVEFTSLPDYSAHRGQLVTVVRPLRPHRRGRDDGEFDFEGEAMFRVRAADGWEGDAWRSELIRPLVIVTIRVSPYITWQGPASRAAEAGRF